MNKILSGFLFGLGFSVSCLLIYTAWMFLAVPAFMNAQFSEEWASNSAPEIASKPKSLDMEFTNNFHELSLDEQIAKSTVVLTTKFEKTDSGKYIQVVDEILKKKEGVELYYDVGDKWKTHRGSIYTEENRPLGFVVFMEGSPASMRYSVSYSEDRIGGLGDIPMSLLRDKCSA